MKSYTVREIRGSERNALLALYLHLHETAIPDITDHLQNTQNRFVLRLRHHSESDARRSSVCIY